MLIGETPFYKKGMDQSELFRTIVKGVFIMPDNISEDAQDIISGLLQRHPSKRLGNLVGGLDDILQHSWLCLIDHDSLLLKEKEAPMVPKIKDPFDNSNFDDWSHLDDKIENRYPPLTKEDETLFDEF